MANATPDFYIKAHDRLPAIQATLATLGAPTNLTGSTVKFLMATGPNPGATLKVNAAATITSATGGIVTYNWGVGDTSTPGDFYAEWAVTFPSGLEQTFPSNGYHWIRVVGDLDGL